MAGLGTRKFTGTKRTGSAGSSGRSAKGLHRSRQRYPIFAICVENKGYEGSLRKGKVYEIIRPQGGDQSYDARVIDEEGEDYLYPNDWFVPIDLSKMQDRILRKVRRVLAAAD